MYADEFERERAAMVERQAQPMNVEPEDDTQQMLGSQKYLTNSGYSEYNYEIPTTDPVCSRSTWSWII